MSISANLSVVRTKMASAVHAAGQGARDVRLIAVCKFQPLAAVEEALAAGQRVFGENRVQEAVGKFGALRGRFPDLELHLIGALQTNKAALAVEHFDVIQTVDRPALADALAKAVKKVGRVPRFYIEVNVGGEAQKAGVAVAELEGFLRACREDYGLVVSGLMCIPPAEGDPVPYFRTLKALADRFGLGNISMGMSGDFEAAIACGATEVRVGTAVFGERNG